MQILDYETTMTFFDAKEHVNRGICIPLQKRRSIFTGTRCFRIAYKPIMKLTSTAKSTKDCDIRARV